MPLVLAATPIGRADDASPRLRTALETADVVAAEDTRRLQRLARDLGIRVGGRIVAFYDAVERGRGEGLLADLREGRTVLVVTDAGMPVVSDPGWRLVNAAAAEGLPITVLPGPSAVTTAVALSGLPVDRWCFEGFLPRKSGERRTRLQQLARDDRALVLFEAPHRLADSLHDLADVFGADRPAAVCRELTKEHEEVRRGSLGELVTWAQAGVRGEVTVVVGGATDRPSYSSDDLRRLVEEDVAGGRSRRDAVDAVATATGVSRREVYAAALEVK